MQFGYRVSNFELLIKCDVWSSYPGFSGIHVYDCSCRCFVVTVESTLMEKRWIFYCQYLSMMYRFLLWLLASKALTRPCSVLICDHELCFTPTPSPNGLLFRGWGGGGGGGHSVSHHRNSFPLVEGYFGHMQSLLHFCVIMDRVQIQENFFT